MGFAFFDKNTRPYRPTPQLRAFLAAFEPALRNLENARALHQATGEKMRIRFAALIEISRLYFSKALVSYARSTRTSRSCSSPRRRSPGFAPAPSTRSF